MGRATPNQVRFLEGKGYADAMNFTFEHASKLIGDLKQSTIPTPSYPKPVTAWNSKPKQEYHLTPEAINAHALSSTIAFLGLYKQSDFQVILMKFKAFIETGEWVNEEKD